MKEKIWEIRERKHTDLIDQILYNRGITKDSKEKFFKPDFQKDLNDPFEMKNLKKAVLKINEAIKNNEKIGIYTDYDADGIPAGALLYRALTKMGAKAYVFIPNRETGYGLSEDGINYLRDKGCSIIITADLGIKNFKEAKYCKEQSIFLIITDHHLPDDELPEANIIINPKIKGDKYPFKELAGCGVIYKLIQGFAQYDRKIDDNFLKWNLDLVAIATISDMVPLIGENRVLARYGLIVLNKTKNLGLGALIKSASLKDKKLEAYHVGFQLGPRINAPGRMDHATKSYELLVTEDKNEAESLASWLSDKNEHRQLAMEKAETEAMNIIEKDDLAKNKIIILSGEWPKGIIGPTASRIVEKYCRPAILFAKDGQKLVGSARGVPGINLVELIGPFEKQLIKFGGHKSAAGLSVEEKNYSAFVKGLTKLANEQIPDELLVKRIFVDAKIKLSEMTNALYDKITQLEPFGMGNSKPVFVASGIALENPRFVGKMEKHLSFLVSDGKDRFKSICFNSPIDCSMIGNLKKCDIAFNLDINTWNNATNLNLNVIDVKQV